MPALVLKYYSHCQFPHITLVCVSCAATSIWAGALPLKGGQVFPELMKPGTHGPVSGEVRMNLIILCLLILDHVWSDETLLAMHVL